MIPILYDKDERSFSSNGLGRLPDASDLIVEEILNGEYELTMSYPSDGLHADLIENDRIILAEPEPDTEAEPFRIYSVEEKLDGTLTVNAHHISYWLSYIPVTAFTAASVPEAMAGLKSHAAEECPFSFETDRLTAGNFSVTTPKSIRACFGGSAGSLLDVYGHGEYWYNRFAVHFNLHRGQDRKVSIRYGKNLTDLTQEAQISTLFTGIYPYWENAETGERVTLPEKVIHTEAADAFSFPRTQVIDLSDKFEEAPTTVQLREAAQKYITANGVGVPDVSLTISFVALWQTMEYAEIAPLERIQLGDTVTVLFEKLGISTSAQVVRTKYNVLKGRYDEIELGSTRPNFADAYVAQAAETDQKITEAVATLDHAIQEATDKISGNNGGYLRINDANGDGEPDELLIMDTDDISTARNLWRWNLSGLGHSSNGYNGTYGLAMTMDGKINASYITTGTLNAASINVINLSASSITAGILKDPNNNFNLNMSTGLLTAKNLVIDTPNLKLNSNGTVEVEGNINATSGEVGLFTIDENGIKNLSEIASGAGIYQLTQLYKDRLRYWYDTTSDGEYKSSTKEIFGYYTSSFISGFDCYVNAFGLYSTGDIVVNANKALYVGGSRQVTMNTTGLTIKGANVAMQSVGAGAYVKVTNASDSQYGVVLGDCATNPAIRIDIPMSVGGIRMYNYNLDGESLRRGYFDPDYVEIAGVMYATDFVNSSDRRLKGDIADLGDVSEGYRKLMPKTFVFNDDENKRKRYGLIAQEVMEGLPELVTENKEGYYGIAYEQLHAFHIKMIQTLMNRVEELERRINDHSAD